MREEVIVYTHISHSSEIRKKSLNTMQPRSYIFLVDLTLELALETTNIFTQSHLRWIGNKLIAG